VFNNINTIPYVFLKINVYCVQRTLYTVCLYVLVGLKCYGKFISDIHNVRNTNTNDNNTFN